MASRAKPVIALVPGAYHSPSHYQEFLSLCEKAGYETAAVGLASVGSSDAKSLTVMSDVEAVREKMLLPLLDAGRDAVVFAHSYGGFVAGGSLEGLGPGQRKSGGSVVGCIILAGLPSKGGMSLMTSLTPQGMEPQHSPWVDLSEVKTKGIMHAMEPIRTFYHDVPEEMAAKALAGLQPQAESVMVTVNESDNFRDPCFDGRRAFIYALQDKALPVDLVLKPCVERTGVGWIEREIDASHSAFLSKPQELSEIVLELVKSFETK